MTLIAAHNKLFRKGKIRGQADKVCLHLENELCEACKHLCVQGEV